MSNVLQRATATVGAIMASLLFVTTALAQMPTSPWKKGAPFPEPDEELYGVAVNRQDVRDGRLGQRQRPEAPTTSTTRRPTSGRRSSPCRGRRIMRRWPR
jgi:hypothetical protein